MLGIIKSLSIVCISLVIPGYLSLRFATPDIGVLLILGAVSFFMFLPVIYCFGLNSSETRILREAVYLRRMG
jgi:hypothetical protein